MQRSQGLDPGTVQFHGMQIRQTADRHVLAAVGYDLEPQRHHAQGMARGATPCRIVRIVTRVGGQNPVDQIQPVGHPQTNRVILRCGGQMVEHLPQEQALVLPAQNQGQGHLRDRGMGQTLEAGRPTPQLLHIEGFEQVVALDIRREPQVLQTGIPEMERLILERCGGVVERTQKHAVREVQTGGIQQIQQRTGLTQAFRLFGRDQEPAVGRYERGVRHLVFFHVARQ